MGELIRLRPSRAEGVMPRDDQGKFVATRPPADLLVILRLVAEAARERWPAAVPDPLRIKQRTWDAARVELEPRLGVIPSAATLSARLSQLTGRPVSWSGWLGIAFGLEHPAKVLAALSGEEPRVITAGDVRRALRLVAIRAGLASISAAEYDGVRREWLESERASGRGDVALRRLLPTSEQIIHAAGSWGDALVIAGLAVVRHRTGALPVGEAIALFYAEKGHLPSRRRLGAFGAERGLSVARLPPWKQAVAEGLRAISAHPELPTPPPYGSPAPAAWSVIPLDTDRPGRGVRRYTNAERLRALEQFMRWCAEKSCSPSERKYREWSKGRSVPQLGAMRRGGGGECVAAQVAWLAANPNWRELVVADDARAEKDRQERGAERARARREASEITARIIELLEDGASSSAQNIASALGCSVYKVRHRLGPLCRDGLVEKTPPPLSGRRQQYRLPRPPASERGALGGLRRGEHRANLEASCRLPQSHELGRDRGPA